MKGDTLKREIPMKKKPFSFQSITFHEVIALEEADKNVHSELTSAQLLPDLRPMKPWSISSPVCLRDFKIAGPSSWYVPSPSFSYDISSHTTTSPGYFLNQPRQVRLP